MNVHLCKGDETLEQALAFINDNDPDNRTYTFDKEKDRCYIGDEAGSLTPQIAETQYWVIFLRKSQNLVYRNAVLCYNRTRYWGGTYGETKQG